MFELFDRALLYFSHHPILANAAHFAAGFGLAILLQNYLKGHSYFSAILGWILIAFAVGAHLVAIFS